MKRTSQGWPVEGAHGEPAPVVEAGARSPSDIPAPRWRDAVRGAIRDAKRDRITITAAGVAFYWFLALFPLLFAAIALVTILDLSPTVVSNVNDGIDQAAPGGAADVLKDAVQGAEERSRGSAASVLLALVLALWSASSGMAATQVGLNVAYDVEEDRPFVRKRAMSFLLLLSALALGGLAIALVVFGEPIGDAIASASSAEGVFEVVWNLVRWTVGLVAVTTLIAIFYYLGPNRRPPSWRWLSPGGIVATVLWVIASLGFSLYVSRFGGSYAETYGAIAGVVILVLWLYLAALAVLLGAELNGELEPRGSRSSH